MKKAYRFIFDLDGTLYSFDKGRGSTFAGSKFYMDLKENICAFLMRHLKVSKKEALEEYIRINKLYKGEVSLGVRQEYGIDRDKYFENTWNLNPKKYVLQNKKLSSIFTPLIGRATLLTAAPRIWAIRVLQRLNLENTFGESIYTGEPILRKPNPLIFQKIAEDLSVDASRIISIGDQEESDILPAKSIGMKTIRIGGDATEADFQVENIDDAINLLRKEEYI
ncbi:MAG TPA: HAD-IA family hydrolase [Patescibacteria group bacterium]